MKNYPKKRRNPSSMNQTTLECLEYTKVIRNIADYTVSYLGRRHIETLKPSIHPQAIRDLLDETAEALLLYEKGSSIPLPSLEGIEWVMGHLGKGYVLAEQDIAHVGTFLQSLRQLKKFMSRWESVSPKVSLYARSIHNYTSIEEEIDRSIRNGRVADAASPELAKVRKQMMIFEDRLKKKLDSLLSRHKSILQEALVSQRNGRYVLPIKKEHRRLITGTVLDESSSGQTIYIEPAELGSLQGELNELRFQESTEEQKVLARLTELLEFEEYAIRADLEVVGHYDALFAKAKYAAAIGGRNVGWNEVGRLTLKQARHPLLGPAMVPLDFAIGQNYRSLMITGPNTGGKTVALKTIGLLTLMAQSGLLPSVGEGSEFTLFRSVLADIGDGQSLEHSLSTFSAHVTNLIRILKEADAYTLVLLDELASGTDPGEGIGLSIAVLEELYRRGATIVASTHYNEIKEFAARTPGFRNARMEFDTETLVPLYKLIIGEAGSSYAFQIALKLGMDPRIIERSQQITAWEAARRGDVRQSESERGSTAESLPPQQDINLRHPPQKPADAPPDVKRPLVKGDCVWIYPLKRTGIVFKQADENGNVVVQVQKQKLTFKRKRLSLYIPKEKLYPAEDYDLDIVFESVEARKVRHLMERKHAEGVQLEYREEG
jgi:DNA mismatch repair protein MutS2